MASPQVRLTKDPNALFFFLDHLGERSPFRLEDTPTWDTNIEEGVRWGLRLVEKDEELFGESGNPKAFVVITDGQAWSGSVALALQQARSRKIPIFVVGVGTTSGGIIPQPTTPGAVPMESIRSVLDRRSLIQLAQGGGGEYFEIGQGSDRDVAFTIIDRLRRRNTDAKVVESYQELYLVLPDDCRHRHLSRNVPAEEARRTGVAGRWCGCRGTAARQRAVSPRGWWLGR